MEATKEYNYDWEIPKKIFLNHCNKIGKLLVQFPLEAKRVDFKFDGGQYLEKITKKNIFLKTSDTSKNRAIIKEYRGKIKEVDESEYTYWERGHKRKVLKAIEEGKPVPDEVKKDYVIN